MADKRLRLIVEAVTSAAQQKLRSFQNSIKQFGDQAERSLEKPAAASKDVTQEMGTMAKAGSIFLADMAVRYGRLAMEALAAQEQLAASNLAMENSFHGVAEQYDVDADAVIASLKMASKNTVSEFSAMEAASTAMRLGVATNIDEFEKLMKITYVRARETSKSVAEAWRWMSTGIGRGSPRILDNLNILIKEEQVMEEWAATIGKTADELSMLERQEATRNAVLQQGAADLERWNEMGTQSIDVFEEWNAVSAEMKQEIMEGTLPAVVALTQALIDLQGASQGYQQDARAIVDAVLDEGGTVDDAVKKLEEYNRARQRGRTGLISWQEALDGVTIAEKNLSIVEEAIAERWGQMYQESAKARLEMEAAGDSTAHLTDDLGELHEGLQKAADIWDDYLSDVAEKNWQFARRVADAQWSATQAAEDAAFRLYEIQRDASQRIDDLFDEFYLRDKYDLLDHQREMRRLTEDHLDAMKDLEWEYQWDKKQMLEGAPWWIRQALSKEFAERDRIAKSGDKEALAKYDKYLLERIAAIDPAYAKELRKLQERYEHEEEIDEREARKRKRRREQDFDADQRQQLEALRLQLSQLERELADQRESWQHSDDQRLENEQHAMDNLITDQGHAMDVLGEQVEKKLAEITPIWEHYGEEWAWALIKGLQSGMPYTPVPPGYEPSWENPWAGLQEGLEYVPRTMPAILHRGEAVLTKEEAQSWRAGDHNEIHLHFSGGYTPYQAQRIADAVDSRLGSRISQRSR